MYLGRIVEVADAAELFANPVHPYTEALLSAVPVPDPTRRRDDRLRLGGDVPNPAAPPSGCRFRTRCPLARPSCAEIEAILKPVSATHSVACHVRVP
jgi:oligopeptide/dipeptide ABC transporter ATP-binding protein